MRIGVITLFPQMLQSYASCGIISRAVQAGLLNLQLWNPRDFTLDPHRSVDDRPYGGGPGMVFKAEPVKAAIDAALAGLGAETQVLYLSPQGRRLNQDMVAGLASKPSMILLAGRYEGIDERLLEEAVDDEISIGDYVLNGGEPAAMVLIDAVARLLPGVLGHPCSAGQDSFSSGLLDYPHYTRPEVYNGRSVPPELLSGDHGLIRRWRQRQALKRTIARRPDLLENIQLDQEQEEMLKELLEQQA
ncbi:MAG: tRNA (guanosine(37)-N1)-methyltransferase TrmD [Candidatus Porifericomitaceae bacterium WSBS_2022_MAG_OTU9]